MKFRFESSSGTTFPARLGGERALNDEPRSRPVRPPADERMTTAVRTLVGNGFTLDRVLRKPRYLVLDCTRLDEFGAEIPYAIVVADGMLGDGDLRSIERDAKIGGGRHVVLIGEQPPTTVPCVTWDTFLARLGGPIKTWLPLEPTFKSQLEMLGHNCLPDALAGRPDELFEEYVQAALQFVLANRVHRYGQERRFEVRPDGIAFAGPSAATCLYDAKAYRDGFSVERSAIRQFADYVHDFHQRYEHYLGRVRAFLLISGHFQDSPESIQERSSELLAECGVPLCCVSADVLGDSVALLAQHPAYRRGLDWVRLFSRARLQAPDVRKELQAAMKDGLVR